MPSVLVDSLVRPDSLPWVNRKKRSRVGAMLAQLGLRAVHSCIKLEEKENDEMRSANPVFDSSSQKCTSSCKLSSQTKFN